MSAYKIQTPGSYPEESMQRSEHGESVKSRKCIAAINRLGFFLKSVRYINVTFVVNDV
jgi:hypothetical protein